jgi:alpha-tubulin suppressor-like RCC1 family protein
MSSAHHSILLNSAGTVATWGYNVSRQLGDGSDNSQCCNRFDRSVPGNAVKGAYSGTTDLGDNTGNAMIQVAGGYRHSLALAADGTVFTWGSNNYGEGGTSVPGNTSLPARVLAGAYSGTTWLGDNSSNKVVAAAGGVNFSVAVTQDGLVYTWGWNNNAQLGDNTTTDRATPIRVLAGAYAGTTFLGDNSSNRIVAIAAGQYHVLALAQDGTVYAWGLNGSGQLGNNSTTGSGTPVRVLKGAYGGTTYLGDNGSNPVIAIAAGGSQSMALMQDGTVFMWGLNSDGQLGDNTTTNRLTPVHVLKGAYTGTTNLGDASGNGMTRITTGGAHSLALGGDGTVYAWGDNFYGQLGDGSNTDRPTPVRTLKGLYSGTTYLGDNSGNPIVDISAGMNHSLALDGNCTVYSFGRNHKGQLGDSTTTDRNTPVIVSGTGSGGGFLRPQIGGVTMQGYILSQNLPNPFCTTTVIGYTLPKETHVTLELFDGSGRLIRTIVDEVEGEGSYSQLVTSEGLACGVYHYRLTAGSQSMSRTMILLR